MLSEDAIEEAGRLLAGARLEHRVLDGIPPACRPTSLAEAYAVQDSLARHLGWKTAGWFCACTNPEIQKLLGLAEPYYARLFENAVRQSPAVLRSKDYPPIAIECEFGFRLGRDLASRETPYSRDEVTEALAAVHPTIEVVAGYLKDWPKQDVFSVIADNGTDGALICGLAASGWREVDLKQVRVELKVNGHIERSGIGANVLGDPMEAFVWLANARRRDGDGLKAGHIHNTGTATSIYWAKAGEVFEADFAGLGQVDLALC